jgi:co-chaperonin GroES (HSP10)
MEKEPVKHFRPFAGRALVELLSPSLISKGGIHIPETATAAMERQDGLVLCVAQEPHHWENGQAAKQEMREGQIVVFGKYAGLVYKPPVGQKIMAGETLLDPGKEYRMLSHNDGFAEIAD